MILNSEVGRGSGLQGYGVENRWQRFMKANFGRRKAEPFDYGFRNNWPQSRRLVK